MTKNIERQMTKRISQTQPMTKLKLMTKMGKWQRKKNTDTNEGDDNILKSEWHKEQN